MRQVTVGLHGTLRQSVTCQPAAGARWPGIIESYGPGASEQAQAELCSDSQADRLKMRGRNADDS